MLTQYSYPRYYYEYNPDNSFAPGDIWSDLPTHGLLRIPFTSAIVITPACDLANDKVETITYLPIVSVVDYCMSRPFVPTLQQTLSELATQLPGVKIDTSVFSGACPPVTALDEAEALITHGAKLLKKQKDQNTVLRMTLGLRLIRQAVSPSAAEANPTHFRDFFGEKAWNSTCRRIVTNAHRTDIHFLPADQQDREWSILKQHALAMFRYPLTAPIEIFKAACDLTLADWPAAVDGLASAFPLATAFRGHRPIKYLRLAPAFMGDMLTRFTSLYNRLGSPDFTPSTIDLLAKSLGGTET